METSLGSSHRKPGAAGLPWGLPSTGQGPPWTLTQGCGKLRPRPREVKRIVGAHIAARHFDESQQMERGEKGAFSGAPYLWAWAYPDGCSRSSSRRGGQELRTREERRVGLCTEDPATPSFSARLLTSVPWAF